MNQSGDEIQSDLRSGDPPRIQAALKLLLERMKKGPMTTVAPFGIEIFDSFGADPSEEAQLDFLTIMARYQWFAPPLSPDERTAAIVKTVLRSGESYVAFDAALKMKVANDPVHSVDVAMDTVASSGLPSPRSIAGISHFVSCLLDGERPVRRAAFEKLRSWPDEAPYREVIEYVKPELEPGELELLGR